MINIAKTRILVVCPDFVYPPNHGGRVDIWNRIKALNKLGGCVDIVCTVKNQPLDEYVAVVQKYANKLFLTERKNTIEDMFFYYPLQFHSRRNLKNIKINNYYDLVLLEDTSVFGILENDTLRYDKLLLRLQNNNNIYYRNLSRSESVLWKKLYFFIESLKFKKLDKAVMEKVGNVAYISIDEMLYCNKNNNIKKVFFLPAAIDLNIKKQSLSSHTVLLLGNLFMPNNQEGIKFYMEKIHPKLLDVDNYKLIIAGNSRGISLKWLDLLCSRYNNIKIYDSPKTLESIYAASSVFVNPLLHGAGVKLRTINAIENGMPVVSTKVGNEGTGLINGEHIMISDDSENIVKCIKLLLKDEQIRRKLAINAQNYLIEHYNHEMALKQVLASL